MLASAARNLAAPRVHGCSLDLSEVAASNPARGLLNVGAGALEVAAMEDNASLLAGVDHLVHIGELRADGLVGGDAAHTCLGRGDHCVLDELAREDDDGEVGDLVHLLIHLLGVLVERLDAETLANDVPPVVVVLGDGDDLGILEGVVDIGVVLAHTTAANDRHS